MTTEFASIGADHCCRAERGIRPAKPSVNIARVVERAHVYALDGGGCRVVRRLGDFSEFGGSGGSMAALVRDTPDDAEARVVAYLRAGVVLVDVMEMTPDVLDGARVRESGSLVTDGDWYWREDLAHYVAKYHLSLDGAFRADIAARQFAPPEMSEADAIAACRAVVTDWSRPSERAAGAMGG